MLKLNSINLTYTRTCPLRCRHCITESSPLVKDTMDLDQASGYLPAIAQFAPELCITGGEPFLRHREIVELAKRARALGLRVSVVTGAGWVKRESNAKRKLRSLADAGVQLIGISWDVYHAEQTPIGGAVMVARLATELGMQVAVRVTVPANAGTAAYERAFEGIPVLMTRSPTLRLGQAKHLPDEHFHISPAIPAGTCPVVLHPNIEPDGKVYACCGPARLSAPVSHLMLGDARKEPLEDILRRSTQDPILMAINLRGPQFLHYLIDGVDCGVAMPPVRSSYSSMCELCMDMTNAPKVVSALRDRLQDIDALVLLEDARQRAKHPGNAG
jgi:hypothetical protein